MENAPGVPLAQPLQQKKRGEMWDTLTAQAKNLRKQTTLLAKAKRVVLLLLSFLPKGRKMRLKEKAHRMLGLLL